MKRSTALPSIRGNGCRWSRITARICSSAVWPKPMSFSPSREADAVVTHWEVCRLTMPNEYKTAQERGVIARYRSWLPVSEATPIVSLGEGDTPLIHSPRLSREIGRDCEVWIKYEGLNPTGSFKDRGMTVAVSKAVEQRVSTLICASTGNTSASAAAYAARAGLRCV